MVYPAIVEGRKLLLGVCCNTFHDEPTFRPFLQRLCEPWEAGMHGRHFAVTLTGGGLEDLPQDAAAGMNSGHALDVDVVNMPLQVISVLYCVRMNVSADAMGKCAGGRRHAPRRAARGRHLLRRY